MTTMDGAIGPDGTTGPGKPTEPDGTTGVAVPVAGEFVGLVAVVTGGASGIGLATATLLAQRGARVVCLDLRPEGLPAPLVGEFADLADDASVRAAVAAVVGRFDGIDILVNNAGVGAKGQIGANDDAEWHRVLDVNVVGLARVTRAALPHLRASAHAAIVNVASIAAHTGLPERALYSASKGAIQALTLAMAADHVAEGIRVNCVNPGTADTPWVRRLLDAADDPAAELAALRARQPNGRLVAAAEVAHAICYLASPLAAGTTGAVLAVDGGTHGVRVPGPAAAPAPNAIPAGDPGPGTGPTAGPGPGGAAGAAPSARP